MNRRPLLALLLLAAQLLLAGCGRRPVAPPRLVVLYLPCTLNRDFLQPFNPQVSYTPNLQRLAARSVVFPRHQTEAPQSGPAFASLFTGSRTSHHGVYINAVQLRDEVEVVFETFAGGGYDVFAWLNHNATRFNYAQGVPAENLSYDLLTAEDPGLRGILDRLQADPDYRVLIASAFTVTHGPYSIDHLEEFCGEHPSECGALADRERFDAYYRAYLERLNYITLSFDLPRARANLDLTEERLGELAAVLELAYKSNVYHLDRLFGALVDSVETAGLLDQSLIAFAADHGEVLYRDNAVFNWTHAALDPESINVPFLLLAPGQVERPGSYAGVTRAIDLFPTVAGFSGLKAPGGPPFGTDLSAAIRGEIAPPELLAFSHSTSAGDPEEYPDHRRYYEIFPGPEPQHMWAAVRTNDLYFKRVSGNGRDFVTQLFDLAVDREQRHDLFDPANRRHRRMEQLLETYKSELNRGYWEHLRPRTEEEDQERIEALRALGYL